MRSRFMQELTTPEVEEYLKRGGDIALLPVGCVEMHGPHQPLGTDTYIAKAFALRMAELGDGLVLPEVHYSWAGATDGFAGTVSVEPELLMRLVEGIAAKCVGMGFRRFIIVSVHAPNNMTLGLVVRRFFEKHKIPIVLSDPYRPLSDEAGEILGGAHSKHKEASLVLASLHILGQRDLYQQEQMAYDDEAPPMCRPYWDMRPASTGWFMQDPRHHACPSKDVSLQRGLRYFELQLAKLVPHLFEQLDLYIKEAAKQPNKGTW